MVKLVARELRLGKDLSIAAEDFIESATLIVAKRGKGKSGGVKVILEELCKAKLPFLCFDPAGVLWGIRSSFDGKEPSGYKVVVVGGEKGDLPLDRRGGALAARAVADSNASFIFDFKGQPKASYREFVTDFSEELFRINKTPRLVVIEEASRLIPQRLMGAEQLRAFSAVEQIATLGRNQGLGFLAVNQRLATINKDVATQVDRIIVMGTLSPQDRKSIREWVEENAEPERLKEFLDGLVKLQPREAWIWDPEHDLFQPFRFRDFTTFHPDRTHLRRHGWLKLEPAKDSLEDVIASLGSEMKKLAEKAKSDNPDALRAEVARLKKELSSAQKGLAFYRETADARPAKLEQKRVEVPVLKDAQIKRVEALSDRLLRVGGEASAAAKLLADGLFMAKATTKATTVPVSHTTVLHPPSIRRFVELQVSPTTNALAPEPGSPSDGSLPKGERIVLTAIAQYPDGVERDQLSVLTGYKRSSRDAYSQRLRERGHIHFRGDTITATPLGILALGADFKPLPTGIDLRDHWLRRLPEGERRILEVVLAPYPDRVAREQIDEATGYKRSSRDAYLQRLKARRLVEIDREGVVASRTLFEGVVA